MIICIKGNVVYMSGVVQVEVRRKSHRDHRDITKSLNCNDLYRDGFPSRRSIATFFPSRKNLYGSDQTVHLVQVTYGGGLPPVASAR